MAVQVRDELGQQRVLLRDVGLGVGHGCDYVYTESLSSSLAPRWSGMSWTFLLRESAAKFCQGRKLQRDFNAERLKLIAKGRRRQAITRRDYCSLHLHRLDLPSRVLSTDTSIRYTRHGRCSALHVFPPPHGPSAPGDTAPIHALLYQHTMSCRRDTRGCV